MKTFEAVAEVGDTVKCYDFEPFPGREDRFVIGTVVEKGYMQDFGFAGYRVAVTEDTVFGPNGRTEIVAPFEMFIMEFDGRITKVEAV